MAARKSTAPEVKFSNLEKIFFPADGFSKGDLIRYYLEIAPVLLPHFRDRPVTRIRMPDGVRGERFYEKNAPGYCPAWVPRAQVPRSEGGVINYIVIQDPRVLAWVANDAAVELHPFLHRADDISRPTHIAFDLDPGQGADLLACIAVARHVQEVLGRHGLKAWPKVTGSKGLQLYVPLNTRCTYASVTPFARALAETLSRAHPDLIVSNMSKALRTGKVFIDWSQNHEKKTTVGAYSVRGKRDEPFVSTPVTWTELIRAEKAGKIEPLFFSPKQVLARVKKHGDLFAPVLELKQRLPDQFVVDAPSRDKVPKALRTYAEKRNFNRTAEPSPDRPLRSRQGSRRRFVIQKHAASHLHYDFRLESGDTLKSWAVPKGIPLELNDRRSAFVTEDHPLEYLDFEGTIVQGEYGGGTVMVWDIGTFDTVEGHYWKGFWKIHLNGEKLQGEWTLERVDDEKDKPRWVLTKTGRPHKPISPKLDDSSAVSKRSMQEIARANDVQWDSSKPAAEARTTVAKPRRPRSDSGETPKTSEPKFVEPMLARFVDALPEGPEWRYEIKWDGWRGLGIKHGDRTRLFSRNAKSLDEDFPQVVEALKTLRATSALVDGEVVALDEKGRPTFSRLVRGQKNVPIVFYAFDLLELDGQDLRKRPHEERTAKLAEIAKGSSVLISQSFDGPAEQVAEAISQLGLEGVVAKRRDSTYESGERSGAWVKFVFDQGQEFVVGGYTRGTPLQSLVVGYYDPAGKLICVGKVPGGLNPRNRRELYRLLEPIASDVCPFANLPSAKRKSITGGGITKEDMKKIQWVIPRLVAQVSFRTWTSGGNIRHSSFKGLREDKDHRQVVREMK